MNEYVTDTHAFIWHLTNDERLSRACRAVFEAADRGASRVIIPAMVLVEAVYPVEKARFPAELLHRMLDVVEASDAGCAVAPLGVTSSLTLARFPCVVAGDPSVSRSTERPQALAAAGRSAGPPHAATWSTLPVRAMSCARLCGCSFRVSHSSGVYTMRTTSSTVLAKCSPQVT